MTAEAFCKASKAQPQKPAPVLPPRSAAQNRPRPAPVRGKRDPTPPQRTSPDPPPPEPGRRRLVCPSRAPPPSLTVAADSAPGSEGLLSRSGRGVAAASQVRLMGCRCSSRDQELETSGLHHTHPKVVTAVDAPVFKGGGRGGQEARELLPVTQFSARAEAARRVSQCHFCHIQRSEGVRRPA